MRSPVSRRAKGECQAIRSWRFSHTELTFVRALGTALVASYSPFRANFRIADHPASRPVNHQKRVCRNKLERMAPIFPAIRPKPPEARRYHCELFGMTTVCRSGILHFIGSDLEVNQPRSPKGGCNRTVGCIATDCH